MLYEQFCQIGDVSYELGRLGTDAIAEVRGLCVPRIAASEPPTSSRVERSGPQTQDARTAATEAAVALDI
jgi:hypothetical protein